MDSGVFPRSDIRETLNRLKATGRLPSPKGVALEIMRLSQLEYVSNAQITRVIQADPALAGRLIKAANTASRGNRRPIIAVGDALLVLGLPVVKQLALGFSLISESREGASKRFNYEQFWSRSLLMGTALQSIALRVRMAAPEETFVCGLLSGIGELALVSTHPQECDDILAHAHGLSDSELRKRQRERLGVDHLQLTVLLLLDWGFPDLVTQVALAFDQPDVAMPEEGSRNYLFVRSMQLAAKLSIVALAEGTDRRKTFPGLLLAAARLGIDAEELQAILDEVVSQWSDWGKLLQVPTHAIVPLADSFDDAVEVASQHIATLDGDVVKGNQPLRVLVVDDDPAIVAILRRLLTSAGHTIFTASDGAQGLERALASTPDLVITDWQMPVMDGLQFCRALRATKLGRGIHVLMLTGLENEENLVEAFEAGADDYVNKPFSPRALSARLRAAQRVIQMQGDLKRDAEEMRRIASELAVNNRRLQQAAMTDPLTDLPNRRYALDRLEQERAATTRRRTSLSCVLVDIDNFKRVNDQYGHDAGDAMLRHIAACLRDGARVHDAVTRIGGDELLIICPDTDANDAYKCAERLRLLVAASPLIYAGQQLATTISLGVASMEAGTQSISDLLACADQALYMAKHRGRNQTAFLEQVNPGFTVSRRA